MQVHYHALACPYGLSWLHRVQQGPRDGSGSKQPLFGSLELLLELASTNAAETDMFDHQERDLRVL